MNTPLSLLLSLKGSEVISIVSETPIADAVHLMNERHIGALLVTDATNRPVGIFTERDVLSRVVGAEIDVRTTPVGAVMTAPLVTATPATAIEDAMNLFMEQRIRHLPLMEDGMIVGILSIGDVNRWLLEQFRTESRLLRCYVHGDPACPA